MQTFKEQNLYSGFFIPTENIRTDINFLKKFNPSSKGWYLKLKQYKIITKHYFVSSLSLALNKTQMA
jgi:hypothetical protein